MASIGETFKAARLAKGVDVVTASRVTRIKQSQLDAMERDDFRSIPAPVYVRGFIKQYAQYLGLDPAPLIADYNAGLSGSRPAAAPSLRPAGTGPARPEPGPAPPVPPPPAAPAPPPEPASAAARETAAEPAPPPETPPSNVAFSWPAEADPPVVAEPTIPASEDLFAGLKPVAPPPEPPPPAAPPPAPAHPKFQPVVMETGSPELLQRPNAAPAPEKTPAWKEPVVMESGRLVRERQQEAGAGDRFRPSEPAPPAASGDRKRGPLFPPGVMQKVGIAVGACLLLVILFRSCGGRPDYTSIRDVPIPDNPVLREPSDPYMQSR